MSAATWTHTAFAGAGHARHAFIDATREMACGAHRRPGVIINHKQRFQPDDVTCARCRKSLGLPALRKEAP